MAEMESGQDFAARYWGGANVTPERCPAGFGPRDIDGGRVRFPVGWRFRGDGFTYRVWQDDTGWHMQAHDGSFARFRLDGDHWVVDGGWSRTTRRIEAHQAAVR